jgi:hypothetical protein
MPAPRASSATSRGGDKPAETKPGASADKRAPVGRRKLTAWPPDDPGGLLTIARMDRHPLAGRFSQLPF